MYGVAYYKVVTEIITYILIVIIVFSLTNWLIILSHIEVLETVYYKLWM